MQSLESYYPWIIFGIVVLVIIMYFLIGSDDNNNDTSPSPSVTPTHTVAPTPTPTTPSPPTSTPAPTTTIAPTPTPSSTPKPITGNSFVGNWADNTNPNSTFSIRTTNGITYIFTEKAGVTYFTLQKFGTEDPVLYYQTNTLTINPTTGYLTISAYNPSDNTTWSMGGNYNFPQGVTPSATFTPGIYDLEYYNNNPPAQVILSSSGSKKYLSYTTATYGPVAYSTVSNLPLYEVQTNPYVGAIKHGGYYICVLVSLDNNNNPTNIVVVWTNQPATVSFHHRS